MAVKSQMPKDYNLIKEIRAEKQYKNNNTTRDRAIRKELEQLCPTINESKGSFLGQLCYFDYFEPKYQDQLEYYDAKPVIFLFGKMKTKEGKPRILGFNIHYFPPRIRYQVMNRFFEIYKPYYRKGWKDGVVADMSHVDYKMLLDLIEKAKLSFGVREYIPELISKFRIIPPNLFSKVVFTEGYFKKRTRTAIMNYWKNYKDKYGS